MPSSQQDRCRRFLKDPNDEACDFRANIQPKQQQLKILTMSFFFMHSENNSKVKKKKKKTHLQILTQFPTSLTHSMIDWNKALA